MTKRRPPQIPANDVGFIRRAEKMNRDEFAALRDALNATTKSINDGGSIGSRINHTLILAAPAGGADRDWAIRTSLLVDAFNIAYPNRAIEHSIHHDDEGDVIVIHGKEMLTRLARLGIEFPQSHLYLHFAEKDSERSR